MTALALFALWSILYLVLCFLIGSETKPDFKHITYAIVTWFVCASGYSIGYLICTKLFF